jgi:hypothetical protein
MTGLPDDQAVLIIGRGSGIACAAALAARDAGARRRRRPRQGNRARGLRQQARYRRPPSRRRIGTAKNIANAVLFALTSTFLTGQTLHIDGGEPLT